MDKLESKINDFDLAMMNNQFLKNLLTELETTAKPPQFDDVFSLSPSQDEVAEIDTVIHDFMTTQHRKNDKSDMNLSYSEDKEVGEVATATAENIKPWRNIAQISHLPPPPNINPNISMSFV